jgi:hypothetical protein
MDGSGAAKSASFGKSVLLRSFENISAYEFSFPFQGMTKIREALKIKFKSLLGDGALHVSLIPFLTKIEKKSASGCVFVIRNDEKTDQTSPIPDAKAQIAVAANCAVWPKPLVFACEAAPDGLLVCSDENRVSSVWFKNWTPVFLPRIAVGLHHAVGRKTKRFGIYRALGGTCGQGAYRRFKRILRRGFTLSRVAHHDRLPDV